MTESQIHVSMELMLLSIINYLHRKRQWIEPLTFIKVQKIVLQTSNYHKTNWGCPEVSGTYLSVLIRTAQGHELFSRSRDVIPEHVSGSPAVVPMRWDY